MMLRRVYTLYVEQMWIHVEILDQGYNGHWEQYYDQLERPDPT